MDPEWPTVAEPRDEVADSDQASDGDSGIGPDDPSPAYDDEQVRRAIDALIHPEAAASRQPAAASSRRSSAPTDPSGAAPIEEDLGLCRADVWHRLLAVEHARAARYGTRTTVVLLDIADIAQVVALLGATAAGRLVQMLADTVRESTRAADTFARIDRSRFAGLLLETDGPSADHPIGRVRDGFRRRLEGRLTLELVAGRAELDPRLDPLATLARAEGSMHLRPGRDGAGGPRERLAGAQARADDGSAHVARPAWSVADRLRELEQLHADGFVTDDEYRAKRQEVLRRI